MGRPLPSESRARGLLGWALFAGFAVALYVLLRSEGTDPAVAARDFARTYPLAAGAAAGAAAVLLATFLWLKWIVDRQTRSYRSRITFDAAGFTEQTPSGETVHQPWSTLSAWVETENLLVVRIRGPADGTSHGAVTGRYFPKRLFASPSDVEAVRRLLAEGVRGPIG